MGLSAVTVLGVDRPGVIAAVTGSLADCGANIQDSTMTLLGGHVAMMLLVSGDLDCDEVLKRLRTSDLVVTASAIEARRHFCEEGTASATSSPSTGPTGPGSSRPSAPCSPPTAATSPA